MKRRTRSSGAGGACAHVAALHPGADALLAALHRALAGGGGEVSQAWGHDVPALSQQAARTGPGRAAWLNVKRPARG